MDKSPKRVYRRTCVVCGAAFESACTNAIYCDRCRSHANYLVAKMRRQARAREPKPEKQQITVYTCVRCGRSIKAYGRCTNRKICDECLMSTNSKDDLDFLMQRKEVREEVIE